MTSDPDTAMWDKRKINEKIIIIGKKNGISKAFHKVNSIFALVFDIFSCNSYFLRNVVEINDIGNTTILYIKFTSLTGMKKKLYKKSKWELPLI